MPVALTRAVSPAIADCELTHLSRVPIDASLARAQHAAYEDALRQAGYRVQQIEAAADMPDSVFVEDVAVAVREVAIATRPGAESRRAEVAAVADALAAYRPVANIAAPGTLDGGDVLVMGKRVYVGLSGRTNAHAIDQMRRLLAPLAYTVTGVDVRRCLHLKSAVTALADDVVLLNRAWVDPATFAGCSYVDVDPAEPMAANALRLTGCIVYPAAFPRTAERIAALGLTVHTLDVSELAKAEGGVTCCSVLID